MNAKTMKPGLRSNQHSRSSKGWKVRPIDSMAANWLPLTGMRGEIVDRVATWRNGPADDDMLLVLVEAQ